jgi:hypothetical protein
MSDNTDQSEEAVDRLFTDYGELHLLLDADPQVLHETIFSCEPEQLEKIMGVMENQLADYQYHAPADLPTAQQFLSVWFMALRAWDYNTREDGSSELTDLDFETLKYNQHWE